MWINRWTFNVTIDWHWWMVGVFVAWPYILFAIGPLAVKFNRESIHV